MDQTRRGSSGFAAEVVGSHLDNLRIAAAAADHTGSDTHWGIAGKAAGCLLDVVRKEEMAERASRLVEGQVG